MLIILTFWPSQEYIGPEWMDEVASYVIHRKLLDLDFLFPSISDEMLKIELLSIWFIKGFIMLLEDSGIGRLE